MAPGSTAAPQTARIAARGRAGLVGGRWAPAARLSAGCAGWNRRPRRMGGVGQASASSVPASLPKSRSGTEGEWRCRGRSGGRAGAPARGEVAADAEVGGVLDEGAFEGDVEGALDQFARLQGDEGVPGEQAGSYGRPLRHAGRVVEVDLVDRAELGAIAVERLAADQVARIDVGLHGPSTWSQLIRKHYKRAHRRRRPLERAGVALAGRLTSAADPVRESPPDIIGGAEGANPPRNLSGSRTARTRSLWKAERVSHDFRSHRR